MKIAIITSGLLPVPASKGGAIETLLDSFLQQHELSKNEFKFTIYSISNTKSKEIVINNNYRKTNYIFINGLSNLIIRIINKFFKRNIAINKCYQNKVVKLINKAKFDFVIIENYPELVLKIKSSKVIPYIHSDIFNKEIYNAKKILEHCYRVMAVSNYINNRVSEIDISQKDKIITVYNSIDFNEITTEDYLKYRKEIRKKYGILSDDFVYTFSGRISNEKGPLELLKAFNKLKIPNKKLLIIGGIWYGSNKKDNYLIEMENNSDSSIIYTGYIKHSEIQKILCATDVGVVPSICNEAAGLSVVEFMNMGNIVVASNRGGINEYIEKENNYLINFENKDEMVNNFAIAMEKCYNNKDYIKEILISNYEFSKKFIPCENYNKIISILESSE